MNKRIRNWLIGIILLGAIAGGGYAYYQNTQTVGAQESEAEEEVQTATARQGDLTISAIGAGTTIPFQEINLGFGTGGTLTELNVAVGDNVTAGDVLARVDDGDAQQALVNAQLALSKLMLQTDAASSDLGTSFNTISIEQAELNLEQAERALDDLINWEPDASDIAMAEANLASAQAGLSSAQGQQSSSAYSIEISRINLEQAQRDLETAQGVYDVAYDPGRDWELQYDEAICDDGEPQPCTGQTWQERIERERASADSSLIRATDALSIAQIQYNQQVAGSSSSSVVNAESSILNAELALEATRIGPTEDDILAAERAVTQAKLALQQTQLSNESSLLDLEQSKLNVAAAEASIEGTLLTAPIDGTIMEVTASIGESVTTAPFVILADLERPIVEIFLDESDLNMVGLGFEVDVVFDALPDDTFSGTIFQVDPQITVQNNLNVVRALVQLDADSFAKPQTLPVGVNATVEVIGGRAENAVLVPVEAIRELTPGNFSVFVMDNSGELELRNVEVGLMDFTFAEISSGLNAGEVVTTGIVETQ
ncbi:MAG: efflux RND transporter periplasmic adaptor subunit [Chloroflexota bacterium]